MSNGDVGQLDDRVRLVELLDRVLDRGVVLRGDVTISVAGVDLVYLELRLLLSGMEALRERALPPGSGLPPSKGPPPGKGPPQGRGPRPGGTPPPGEAEA